MRSFAAVSVLPLLVAASPILNALSSNNAIAPLMSSSNSKEIADSYIVVLKDHVTHASASAHRSWVQQLHKSSENEKNELRKRSQEPFLTTVYDGLKHTYTKGFLGYSGHFDESVLEQIRKHPEVRTSCISHMTNC